MTRTLLFALALLAFALPVSAQQLVPKSSQQRLLDKKQDAILSAMKQMNRHQRSDAEKLAKAKKEYDDACRSIAINNQWPIESACSAENVTVQTNAFVAPTAKQEAPKQDLKKP